jgi:hypothetical protein
MWPDNRLCPAAEGRGGTWNNRGEIVFGSRTAGLLRVQASGDTATALTNLTDTQKQRFAANHRFPVFLPDNEHIAYVVQSPPTAQVQLISACASKNPSASSAAMQPVPAAVIA